jgi:hypothetical protein
MRQLYGLLSRAHHSRLHTILHVSQERAAVILFPTVSICNKYPFKMNGNPVVADIIRSTYMNQTLITQLAASSEFFSLHELDNHLEYLTRFELFEKNYSRAGRLKFLYNINSVCSTTTSLI